MSNLIPCPQTHENHCRTASSRICNLDDPPPVCTSCTNLYHILQCSSSQYGTSHGLTENADGEVVERRIRQTFVIGDPISGRIAVYCNDLLWRERRTTSATFLGSISAKLSTNTCPGGGSRHMVSHSRKISIKGSNFRKNRLLGYFRVPYLWSAYGSREMFCDACTLFVP